MSSRTWSLLAATAVLGVSACVGSAHDDTAAAGARHDTARFAAGAADTLSPTQTSAPATAPATVRVQSVGRASVPAGTPSPARVTASQEPAEQTAKPRRVLLGDIDLTGVGYDVGDHAAPVVVIDFSDFGCPYCAQFTRETYPVLEREYVQTGKVFFKYVPFVVGMFPHAAEATRAVECAANQGKFWSAADHVYEAQATWKRAGDPRPLLLGIGEVVGTDTVTLAKCYADHHTEARTARANQIANEIGVRVTPSFVVNGRPIEGALPVADFRRVIDAALLLEKARK